MPSRRELQRSEENAAVLAGLTALRDEMRQLRAATGLAKPEEEEEIQIVLDETTLEREVKRQKTELKEIADNLKELKEYIFESSTGARAFVNQRIIKEKMLELGSAESWKNKTIEDLPGGLSTVQTLLNESRNFDAGKELQGFIEIAEIARETVLVTPAATHWIKKGIDEALGTVLRLGKERKGQPTLWACMTKHHLKRYAENEKEAGVSKPKALEPPKQKKAEFPCLNCAKAGKPGLMHTLTECARLGNACSLECRNCPAEAGTNNPPCHWREFCPTLRKRERTGASRSSGSSR